MASRQITTVLARDGTWLWAKTNGSTSAASRLPSDLTNLTPPLFYVETLADLEKEDPTGREPEDVLARARLEDTGHALAPPREQGPRHQRQTSRPTARKKV